VHVCEKVGKRIYILLLYVDDILAVVDAGEAKRLKKTLTKLFGELQVGAGDRMLYLRIEISIKDDRTWRI
jgi:hypothetical protein